MYLQQRAQCDLCLFKNLAKEVVQLQMDAGAGAGSQERLGHRWKWQPSHLVSRALGVSVAKQTDTATTLPPSSDLCAPALWTRGIFFSRIALLFNFEYYIQWLLWGELRHEELEQSLCWRIFSCSFDVLSCCCSQLYYEENSSLQIVRQSSCHNKIPTFDKHCNLALAGWHHLFALLQAENYSGVRYCTWIRLWTFKPPCN